MVIDVDGVEFKQFTIALDAEKRILWKRQRIEGAMLRERMSFYDAGRVELMYIGRDIGD